MITLAEEDRREGAVHMKSPAEESTEDYLSKLGTGDINSDAKGSGARLNVGKPPMELVPLRLIVTYLTGHYGSTREVQALDHLSRWQERQDDHSLLQLLSAIDSDSTGSLQHTVWQDCANVFDYGRKTKYKAWNWAKGMPWSVPMACAARHLIKMVAGEVNDHESGLPHRGHVACNLVMLMTYAETYPEGDDRPPAGTLGKVNL